MVRIEVRIDSASSRLITLLSTVAGKVKLWVRLEPMSRRWLDGIRNRERAS